MSTMMLGNRHNQIAEAWTIRRITLHFKKPNGEIETVKANEGDDIVDVSWEWDLDIEGEPYAQPSS